MRSKKISINYVDALPGAGKTTNSIQEAERLAVNGKKVLFVQKSTDLIAEQIARLRINTVGKNVLITEFHYKVVDHVKSEIIQHLESVPSDIGEILFITDASFFSLSHVPNKENWNVFMDEIPDPVTRLTMRIPDSFSLIADAIVSENANDHQVSIKPNPIGDTVILRQLASNKSKDQGREHLQKLAEKILSPFFDVRVDSRAYKSHVDGQAAKEKTIFSAHAILNPRIFAGYESVTVLGARFQDQMLYRLWTKLYSDSVEFKLNATLQSSMLYDLHRLEGKVEIKYFFQARWSKTFYNQTINDRKLLDIVSETGRKLLTGTPYIYSINKGIDSEFKIDGQVLSGTPHGLNKYIHIHNGVFLSATNPRPDTYHFYAALGFDREAVDSVYTLQTCYQGVMRLSLRDPSCKEDRLVIVATKKIAEWLQGVIVGAQISQITLPVSISEDSSANGYISFGNTPDALRQDRNRRIKIVKQIRQLNTEIEKCHNKQSAFQEEGVTNSEIAKPILGNACAPIKLQTFKYLKESVKESNLITFNNEDELKDQFQSWSNQESQEKSGWILLSPSLFGNLTRSDGGRTRKGKNVLYSWCIILDFDGDGSFTYHDLLKIFPDNKIWIYNTYGGNGRFRALFFIDRVINPWAFRDICNSLKARIENSTEVDPSKSSNLGFYHGLDTSKFNCSSIFYAPRKSRVVMREVDNFFVVQPGKPLDVLELIKIPIHKEVEVPHSITFDSSTATVDKGTLKKKVGKLVADYRNAPAGTRHDAFFKLAVEIKKLGIFGKPMWSILIEADYDGSRRRDGDFEKINDTFKQNLRDGTYTFKTSRKKSNSNKTAPVIIEPDEEMSVDDENFWLIH